MDRKGAQNGCSADYEMQIVTPVDMRPRRRMKKPAGEEGGGEPSSGDAAGDQ
jgi:hypothetical protein